MKKLICSAVAATSLLTILSVAPPVLAARPMIWEFGVSWYNDTLEDECVRNRAMGIVCSYYHSNGTPEQKKKETIKIPANIISVRPEGPDSEYILIDAEAPGYLHFSDMRKDKSISMPPEVVIDKRYQGTQKMKLRLHEDHAGTVKYMAIYTIRKITVDEKYMRVDGTRESRQFPSVTFYAFDTIAGFPK